MSIEHSIDDILSVKTTRKTANPKKHKLSKSNPSILLTIPFRPSWSADLARLRYLSNNKRRCDEVDSEELINFTACLNLLETYFKLYATKYAPSTVP